MGQAVDAQPSTSASRTPTPTPTPTSAPLVRWCAASRATRTCRGPSSVPRLCRGLTESVQVPDGEQVQGVRRAVPPRGGGEAPRDRGEVQALLEDRGWRFENRNRFCTICFDKHGDGWQTRRIRVQDCAQHDLLYMRRCRKRYLWRCALVVRHGSG